MIMNPGCLLMFRCPDVLLSLLYKNGIHTFFATSHHSWGISQKVEKLYIFSFFSQAVKLSQKMCETKVMDLEILYKNCLHTFFVTSHHSWDMTSQRVEKSNFLIFLIFHDVPRCPSMFWWSDGLMYLLYKSRLVFIKTLSTYYEHKNYNGN